MTKLTLNLESLDVQSFESVNAGQQAGGTAFGADPTLSSPACCYTFAAATQSTRPADLDRRAHFTGGAAAAAPLKDNQNP